MPKKHTSCLDSITVKAEDCYDPADYVMVHQEFVAKLRERVAQAQAFIAKYGTPIAYSYEGPARDDQDTYSVCCDTDEGAHTCFVTVVANSEEDARSGAMRVGEAASIIAAVAELLESPLAADAVDPQAANTGTPSTRA